MTEDKDTTTIQITLKLKEELEKLGKKGDTYEDIIWKSLMRKAYG